MSTGNNDCTFCRVVSGEVRVRVLHTDELVMAIDIPETHEVKRAPVHFVVVPREHLASAKEIRGEHGEMLARLFEVITKVAAEQGIADSGYRLATNVGPDANQTEFHLHVHCIGGRRLGAEG